MDELPTFTQTTVTSTRIRLARNLAAYPFPEKLNLEQAQEIIRAVRYELDRLDDFDEYDISLLSQTDATLLQEKHLISPALIKNRAMSAAFVSGDRSISIMVNEEDHLRQQYILKEFDLYKAFERLNAIDDVLGEKMNFAYDERLGYLTACPSNLGTGMRASVMMFLPGLSKYREIEKLLPVLKQRGMTVRGVFGEGSKAEGYLYQVSNERTLGISEMDILSVVEKTACFLGDLEMHARKRMLLEEELYLRDLCLRAYGTLMNCAILSQEELMEGMIKLRLGLALGFFETSDKNEFNDFVDDMRPASFTRAYCDKDMAKEEKDMRRAEIVRELLGEIIKRVD